MTLEVDVVILMSCSALVSGVVAMGRTKRFKLSLFWFDDVHVVADVLTRVFCIKNAEFMSDELVSALKLMLSWSNGSVFIGSG